MSGYTRLEWFLFFSLFIPVKAICGSVAAVFALSAWVLAVVFVVRVRLKDQKDETVTEKQEATEARGRQERSADEHGTEQEKERARLYSTLGLLPSASREEVTRAYRKLTRQYHPDKVNHLGEEFVEMAHEKFKTIQEVYETLISMYHENDGVSSGREKVTERSSV